MARVASVIAAGVEARGSPDAVSAPASDAGWSIVRALRRCRAWAAPPPQGCPRAAARARRVTLLLPALGLMGITDLLCTILYMGSVGMIELNPLARLIASEGGADNLAAFKLCSMFASCGILYRLRRTKQAELAAWVCAAALTALMIHWVRYSEYAPGIAAAVHALEQHEQFIRLP